MSHRFIVEIGTYNDITTEQIVLREIAIIAQDKYEAHKLGLYKCNQKEEQIVISIKDPSSGLIVFHFQKGFTP